MKKELSNSYMHACLENYMISSPLWVNVARTEALVNKYVFPKYQKQSPTFLLTHFRDC